MARKNAEKAADIKQKIEQWENYWKDNNDTYNEYTQFVFGNQWLDQEARVFETYKKIPLTFNKIAPLINHLLGEQRQNTPSLEVVADNDANVEEIEVRKALVTDITLSSHAKVVYQTAFQCSSVGGYGVFFVDTEYENDFDFKQVIRIRKGEMPTRFFFDVCAKNECKTDGMFAGFKERMSRKKFAAIHGKKLEKSIPPSNLESGSVFNDDESVTIVYYYERKYKPINIYELSNGETIDQDEFKNLPEVEEGGYKFILHRGEPVTIVQERKSPRYEVIRYVYAGDYELECEPFPSQQLPIIFVDQSSFFNKEGTQVTRPFVKDTKDAQRYINYIGTQCAYLLKIGRYDQYLIASGNARSPETAQIWRDPTNIQGGLKFDEVQSGFIPQQQKPPELPMSFVQQYERALMDIQSSTGMYNAQLGEQGNETAGVAIEERNKRGSYTTFIPFGNLNRAIAVCGEVVNEMIPKVYDTERTLMLNMRDRGMTPITINKAKDDYGTSTENDMTKGRYSIRLMPGPSWEGQKKEALESMQMILNANPELFNLIADLYVENLPLNNSVELRNRLRTIVPPEIIEAGKTGQPIPPKPPEPDPIIMVKMQELQLKMQKLEVDKMKIMADKELGEGELQIKIQELEAKKAIAAAELQEMEMRYISESERTISNEQIAHANNLIKLLTHGASLEHQTLQGKKDEK